MCVYWMGMAQISKRPMQLEIEERIYHLLDEVLAKAATEDEARLFLKELMTETEQTVLAKRLAIALMLIKGMSYAKIDEVLKVSPPTVFKVKEWMKYKGEGFKELLVRVVEGEKGGSEVWNGILDRIKSAKIN